MVTSPVCTQDIWTSPMLWDSVPPDLWGPHGNGHWSAADWCLQGIYPRVREVLKYPAYSPALSRNEINKFSHSKEGDKCRTFIWDNHAVTVAQVTAQGSHCKRDTPTCANGAPVKCLRFCGITVVMPFICDHPSTRFSCTWFIYFCTTILTCIAYNTQNSWTFCLFWQTV